MPPLAVATHISYETPHKPRRTVLDFLRACEALFDENWHLFLAVDDRDVSSSHLQFPSRSLLQLIDRRSGSQLGGGGGERCD